MARPEVVKKMWQIIRERNLFVSLIDALKISQAKIYLILMFLKLIKYQDPSDKRFTLCDDQLLKIIGELHWNLLKQDKSKLGSDKLIYTPNVVLNCLIFLFLFAGKKRFNTFAMMKFLKKHLKDPSLM